MGFMSLERIHTGVGGWTFEPWRDNFYPKGLPQKQELQYAAASRVGEGFEHGAHI